MATLGAHNTPTTATKNSSENKLRVNKKNEVSVDQRHRVAVPKEALLLIYEHWVDVGASKHHLVKDKNANKANLEHWYKELVFENQYFPQDLDIYPVLKKFFRSLTHGNTTLAGFNLRNYLQAFEMFWRSNEQSIRAELAPNPPIEQRYLPSSSDTPLNVDRQLQVLYGDDIPEMFHKYVTDKSILNKTTKQ